MSIVQKVLDKLKVAEAPRLVLFDIDSTLVCTSPRTQQILREFAHDPIIKNKFGSFLQPIEQIVSLPTDWGIKTPLSRALKTFDGVDKEAFIEEVRDFWKDRFFSNEYLKYDTPYEGAVQFVNDVFKTGSHVTYLTARDEIRMGKGTREQIKHLGFPAEGATNTQFILKPHPSLEDTDFKANLLSKMTGPWSPIYYFENEPSIIVEVEKVRPDIQIIWMNSVHSKQAEEPHHLPQLQMKFR